MKRTMIIIASLLVAGMALAELPSEKQNELSAEGITNWQAGQNQGQQTHAKLGESIQAPQAPGRDTATMMYDDGTISALPTIFGMVYGNKFSQGAGGAALGTVTLNSFSFYFAEDSTADTGLFFQPASPGASAGVINARASINISGLVNAGASFSNLTTINVINQSALGTTGVFSNTFYLGAWCVNAATVVPVDNEAIGLSTNGPRQQGYTAVSGTGTIVAAMQPFNAVMRATVTSAVTVPVELMAFDAE